jgi:hypothetical protein
VLCHDPTLHDSALLDLSPDEQVQGSSDGA